MRIRVSTKLDVSAAYPGIHPILVIASRWQGILQLSPIGIKIDTSDADGGKERYQCFMAFL